MNELIKDESNPQYVEQVFLGQEIGKRKMKNNICGGVGVCVYAKTLISVL